MNKKVIFLHKQRAEIEYENANSEENENMKNIEALYRL